MNKLTLKQKRFADEYIISGNATQSAIKVGYSLKTARSQGNRLLTNVNIAEYIKKRTEELFDAKAMTISEALALTSSIARGEIQKSHSKVMDNVTGTIEKDITYEHTPTIEERQRSIDHILKVSGAYIDKKEIEVTGTVVFVNEAEIAD